MKVKLLEQIQVVADKGPVNYQPGEVVDLPEPVAEVLIKDGAAEEVKPVVVTKKSGNRKAKK